MKKIKWVIGISEDRKDYQIANRIFEANEVPLSDQWVDSVSPKFWDYVWRTDIKSLNSVENVWDAVVVINLPTQEVRLFLKGHDYGKK